MRKIGKILSILVSIVIVFCMLPIKDAKAASYPIVIVETYCGSVGENVPVTLHYSPAYNYEQLDVVIYDDNGKSVGTFSKEFNNTYSASTKYVTMNWNTAECTPGLYKVEVTKKFYSFYSWHEAPAKTNGYLELYDDLNNGMPENNYSGTESHFTCVQDGLQNGLVNDIRTSFTAWRKVASNYQKEECGEVVPYMIQLQEMYIGESANSIVKEENMFNPSPVQGQQWMLMKYQITNNGSSEIKASDIISSFMMYKYTGNKMTVCDSATLSGDRDNLGIYDVIIASGETKETWLGILVPISQGMPYLKIHNGYRNYSYLNVNPDKATTDIVTEVPTPTPTQEPTLPPVNSEVTDAPVANTEAPTPTNAPATEAPKDIETPNPQPTVSQNPTDSNVPNATVEPTATVDALSTDKKSSIVIATNFSTLSVKNNSLTLKWKKKDVNGYEIQYSTNSKFKSAKRIIVNSGNITTKKLSKLKKNKKYFLRIRTYIEMEINDNVETVYSDWSKTKTKKIPNK